MRVTKPKRWRACLAVAIAGLCVLLASPQSVAQESAASLKTGGDIVTLPGLGRIVFGFTVTVALAVGGVYALKRFLPHFVGRLSATTPTNLTAHTSMQNGIRYHVVKIEGHTILIAEGKSGVAMTVLPGESENSKSPL